MDGGGVGGGEIGCGGDVAATQPGTKQLQVGVRAVQQLQDVVNEFGAL